MYRFRLFATRHSRAYEVVYDFVEPLVLKFLDWLNSLAGNKFDPVITSLEKHVKGLMFDCKMCGNCVLFSTGMSCPMNCPKTIRNGPCGGVRENGNCEVKPDMKCVWVEAWSGASRMRNSQKIQHIQVAVNGSHQGTSAWLRLAENQRAVKQKSIVQEHSSAHD